MSKKLILVYGPSGSGKTTFIRELVKVLPDFSHFSIDQFRKNLLFDGANEPSNDKQAIEALTKAILKAQNVIWETTSANKYYEIVLFEAEKAGFKTMFVRLECPYHIAKLRFENRKEKTVHPSTQTGKKEPVLQSYNARETRAHIVLKTQKASPDELVEILMNKLAKSLAK